MIDFAKILRDRYEKETGETWDELEKQVRERHADFFEMLDQMEE